MRPADLPEVMEVDAACLPRPWSEAVWREEVQSPLGCYLVVEEKGAISGQIGVKHVTGELHVMTLAVRPEHRRRGRARALIEEALEVYPEASRVYLEVRPENFAARNLYRSLGFEETGLRRGYYDDGDAVLMTLYL